MHNVCMCVSQISINKKETKQILASFELKGNISSVILNSSDGDILDIVLQVLGLRSSSFAEERIQECE